MTMNTFSEVSSTIYNETLFIKFHRPLSKSNYHPRLSCTPILIYNLLMKQNANHIKVKYSLFNNLVFLVSKNKLIGI